MVPYEYLPYQTLASGPRTVWTVELFFSEAVFIVSNIELLVVGCYSSLLQRSHVGGKHLQEKVELICMLLSLWELRIAFQSFSLSRISPEGW